MAGQKCPVLLCFYLTEACQCMFVIKDGNPEDNGGPSEIHPGDAEIDPDNPEIHSGDMEIDPDNREIHPGVW